MSSLMIGIIAGTLTTISFIPQAVKIYKTKNAKDISVLTFCIFAVGVFLWLVYGILIRELPVIIANSVTLILILIIILMKIRYK